MTQRRRVALRLGFGLVLACVATIFIAVVVLAQDDWRRVRGALTAFASQKLEREVSLDGPLAVVPGWPVTALELNELTVASRPGETAPYLLHLDHLRVELSLSRLLRGDLVLPVVRLDGPDLRLEKDAQGRANWELPQGLLDGPDPAPETREEIPVVERLRIDRGRLRYRDRTRDMALDVRLARVAGSADEQAPRIALDGRGTLRGQALRFHVTGGSLETLRETTAPYPLTGSLRAGATRASFRGSVRDPIDVEGFDLALTVEGDSAADLYALTGIALLPTPPYRVRGRLRHARDVWHFDDFTGRMGSSDLRGTLRWDPGAPRPRLDGRVLPDVPLALERLAAMDAEVVFDGERVIAEHLPLTDFHLRLRLKDRVLRLSPVRFRSGESALETWASIDGTRDPPAVDLETRLRALPLAPMFEAASAALDEPNVAGGDIDGDGKLRSRGRSLRDVLAAGDGRLRLQLLGGQLSQIVIELVGLDVAETAGFLLSGDRPVPIRCMLADFDIEAGHMRPRALVLDTTDTLVTGSGSLDLGTERIDLRLTPEPKDFSPLSLRTPLTVGGTLGAPAFGVAKSGLIARGAAAAALALVFPPAAIAALFEPGTGEDASCRVLLERAHARAEETEDGAHGERGANKKPTPAPMAP